MLHADSCLLGCLSYQMIMINKAQQIMYLLRHDVFNVLTS